MTTYYIHPLDVSSGTVASSMYYARSRNSLRYLDITLPGQESTEPLWMLCLMLHREEYTD